MTLIQQLKQAREQLEKSERPIFLFDDDPDGLCAFLLLYRLVKAGKGIPLKGINLDEQFAHKINEYQPDLLIILDKAEVDESFLSHIQTNIIWIDHHQPQQPKKALYINPQNYKKATNQPTSQLAYQIAKQDAWIALVGIVSDWQLPPQDIWNEALEIYPDILPITTKDAPTALHHTPAGTLARIFSFNLKGRVSDVLASMKILTRIATPQELLEKKHSQAKLVMKRYEQLNEQYEIIKQEVIIKKTDPLIVFTYNDDRNSFTRDLSNELLANNPRKIIIIARQSNGSYKCSLRSAHIKIEPILAKVINTTGGTGGGHEHACGAVIPTEQFDTFVQLIRQEAKKLTKQQEKTFLNEQ